MNRSTFALLMAAAFVATPLCAMDIPSTSKFDSRIQFVDYRADDVVLLRAAPGLGLRIVFAPDEKISFAGTGFAQGWEFKAVGNSLYIKPHSVKLDDATVLTPTAGKWDTNLMVTTDKRNYDFDLRLLSGKSDGAPTRGQAVAYRVEFRYPDTGTAKAKLAEKKKAVAKRLTAAPLPVNWKYTMQVGKASEDIAPTMAYDDGRFTYLRFPNNRDFPTAFVVTKDKTESIVNGHVDPAMPDVLVIHRVAKELVLRLGQRVVGVYNEDFDMDGQPARSGVTVPGLKRVTIGVSEETE